MKINTLKILNFTVALFVVMIFTQCSTEKSCETTPVKKKSVAIEKKSNAVKIKLDTTSAKHTIVIDNVDDPRQLQEILQILEKYTTENKIQDLNIKTEKKSATSSIEK